MSLKTTLITVMSLALFLVAGVNAQDNNDNGDRSDRLEKVGPNAYRVRPKDSPYEHWFDRHKDEMPTFEGLVIDDARTEPLEYWDAMGVKGLYIKMADYQITDGWILEIPPHGKTKPRRDMFEIGMYFFGGPGHIIIQQEGKRPQQVDYQYRTLFSVPLNTSYQIFNDSDEPVRLVAVTSMPFMINAVDNEKFVFDNDFAFTDRYDAQEDFLTKSEHVRKNLTATNVVKDALEFKLDSYDRRGKGTTNTHWSMAGNSIIDMHVSEMPAGLYKKAHRHSSDAFILLLSGHGYSLTWPKGRYENRVRVDWHEGTIFVPPIYWYHQHLNPDPDESARYMAINAPPIVVNLGLRFNDQIENDLPQIKAEFEREVAKRRKEAMAEGKSE